MRLTNGHHTEFNNFIYNATGLVSVKLIGGDDKVCNGTNFLRSPSVVTVDLSEANIKIGGNSSGVFNRCSNLKTILGELDLSDLTNSLNFFLYCGALEYVRLKANTLPLGVSFQHSENLTADSIKSIVEGLSDTATGQTLTLSKTAVNKAFETSEGANDGSTSAEWLALIATKSNWTISLV